MEHGFNGLFLSVLINQINNAFKPCYANKKAAVRLSFEFATSVGVP